MSAAAAALATAAAPIARVLVVDDDPHLRRSLSVALSRGGFEVTTADDGATAMLLARDHAFDLIVTDYHMKTVDGPDVVRHFKARFGAAIYCAILSGEDDDDVRATCLAAGADEVFVKPATSVDLRRALTHAARRLAG